MGEVEKNRPWLVGEKRLMKEVTEGPKKGKKKSERNKEKRKESED